MTSVENSLNSTLHDTDALSCDLTGITSFALQFSLGVIAFSTLLSELINLDSIAI